MDTEATTSDVSEETNSNEPSTKTAETAEVSTKEADSSSTPDSSSDTDVFEPVSYDDIPEEYRDHVKKHVSEIEKGFKRAYTRKTQEYSASQTAQEREFQRIQNEYQQLTQAAAAVLQDPKKLEAYRQVYGPQLGLNNPNQITGDNIPPEIETVGDLVKYYQNQLSTVSSSLEQKMQQTLDQRLTELQSKQKWEDALMTMRTDPRFSKYEMLITKLAGSDPKYKKLYTGDNAKQILQLAYEDFKNLMRDDLESVKKETIQSLEKKKKAVTQTPRRTVTTEPAKRKLTPEEIIQRVNERCLS